MDPEVLTTAVLLAMSNVLSFLVGWAARGQTGRR